MKTGRAFIILTAMLHHIYVTKGQKTDAPSDLSSNTPWNKVTPDDHVTSESVILESRPSSAYQSSSLPPSANPASITTDSLPSQPTRNISSSRTPALQHVTTLETASVPDISHAATSESKLSHSDSTLSESVTNTAPATSINPNERQQTFPVISSVLQTTQTAVAATPSYTAPSQFVLTGSSKVTGPAPVDQDKPSELDVGDEESSKVSHHPASPLDPLLASLVSIFIICTAVVSAILFLRFRQKSEHPEFHRLQDLPMDDLLEDTPLSRYTY